MALTPEIEKIFFTPAYDLYMTSATSRLDASYCATIENQSGVSVICQSAFVFICEVTPPFKSTRSPRRPALENTGDFGPLYPIKRPATAMEDVEEDEDSLSQEHLQHGKFRTLFPLGTNLMFPNVGTVKMEICKINFRNPEFRYILYVAPSKRK